MVIVFKIVKITGRAILIYFILLIKSIDRRRYRLGGNQLSNENKSKAQGHSDQYHLFDIINTFIEGGGSSVRIRQKLGTSHV